MCSVPLRGMLFGEAVEAYSTMSRGVCDSNHTLITKSDNRRSRVLPWPTLPTKEVGLHAFRHGLGTALSDNGVSPKTVQAILRHTDIQTTFRYYVHSDTDARRVSTTLRQVFAKFSEFFMCWGSAARSTVLPTPLSMALLRAGRPKGVQQPSLASKRMPPGASVP